MTFNFEKAKKRYDLSVEDCEASGTSKCVGVQLWILIKKVQEVVYKEVGKKYIETTPIAITVERFDEEMKKLMKLLKKHYLKGAK